VIFTDDMQMHAITKHYGLEEAIKLAINGGVDIMTFSNNIQQSEERTVDKVHSIILKMVEKGEIKPERIDESFDRIMKLKKQLSSNVQISYYQQQLNQSNQALLNANAEIEQAAEKIKTLEANQIKEVPVDSTSKKKKSKRKKKS
jgi:beta-N-acetylhexosaminidase